MLLPQDKNYCPILGQSHTVFYMLATEEHYELSTVPGHSNPAVKCELCIKNL